VTDQLHKLVNDFETQIENAHRLESVAIAAMFFVMGLVLGWGIWAQHWRF